MTSLFGPRTNSLLSLLLPPPLYVSAVGLLCVPFFQVHMLKERPFWSKVSLFWTFRLADVEGDSTEGVVVGLVFDTWTGSVSFRR